MDRFLITDKMKKELKELIKDNFFAKDSPEAYQTAIKIIDKIKVRRDLDPYFKRFLKEDLNVFNLLVSVNRYLIKDEPILFEEGEIIYIPSRVYKEGKELAKILKIYEDEHMILVQPLRKRADQARYHVDLCEKVEKDFKN